MAAAAGDAAGAAPAAVAPGPSPPMVLDRSQFFVDLRLVALRVPVRRIASVMALLDGHMLARPKIKTVVPDGDRTDTKLILLGEHVTDLALTGLDAEKRRELEALQPPLERVFHTMRIEYASFSTEDVLRKLLPNEPELPSAFETIGHIAHLNLRDHLQPYKHIIAQVILDKNPGIRTVVNKTSTIKNEFRVLPLEVLAGEPTLETEIRQEGCVFRLNFGEVYWNSRLQTEHSRVVALLKPTDIVADMFCGIGPFAIPAARRGCTVYANDLNPRSVHYLKLNAEINQVSSRVHASCADARAFVRELAARNVPFTHALMNLPALAVTFLDVFIGLDPALQRPAPRVHCYLFSKKTDHPHQDAYEQACAVLRYRLDPATVSVHDVRDVAPRKRMLCVSFVVPPAVLRGDVQPAPVSDGQHSVVGHVRARDEDAAVTAAAATATSDAPQPQAAVQDPPHRDKRICSAPE